MCVSCGLTPSVSLCLPQSSLDVVEDVLLEARPTDGPHLGRSGVQTGDMQDAVQSENLFQRTEVLAGMYLAVLTKGHRAEMWSVQLLCSLLSVQSVLACTLL